jgi:hypothetical protein
MFGKRVGPMLLPRLTMAMLHWRRCRFGACRPNLAVRPRKGIAPLTTARRGALRGRQAWQRCHHLARFVAQPARLRRKFTLFLADRSEMG